MAYGSYQSCPHEQGAAASFDVTQVYVRLDSCATECDDHKGSQSSRGHVRTCLGAAAVRACCLLCALPSPLAYLFNLELILGSSIALRRILTGSNLPFVAAYASGVRGESKELFSVTRSDDSNGETYRSLVFSNQFRSQCPDLKECVMSLLPYTKSAISPIPQFSYGPLTRMCSWGMVTRQRRQ